MLDREGKAEPGRERLGDQHSARKEGRERMSEDVRSSVWLVALSTLEEYGNALCIIQMNG